MGKRKHKENTMRILIDADGCSVVDEAIRAAREFQIECLILCDTSHRFESRSHNPHLFQGN